MMKVLLEFPKHWTPQKYLTSNLFFSAISIADSNTTSVKRTINKSKTNFGVVVDHVNSSSGTD